VHQPVDRLVERPVAADGDDELGAAASRALRELDQVPRMLGKERLAVETERGRAVRELRPALARDAVVRRRVDEKDSFAVNRRRT
jgi:hypothetical protein